MEAESRKKQRSARPSWNARRKSWVRKLGRTAGAEVNAEVPTPPDWRLELGSVGERRPARSSLWKPESTPRAFAVGVRCSWKKNGPRWQMSPTLSVRDEMLQTSKPQNAGEEKGVGLAGLAER